MTKQERPNKSHQQTGWATLLRYVVQTSDVGASQGVSGMPIRLAVLKRSSAVIRYVIGRWIRHFYPRR